MRKILFAIFICFAVAIAIGFRTTPQFKPIAVVELFTSQGCSSCPPADQLLGETIFNAKKNKENVFALSFHVDYWNRLGWEDPFSDPAFSERQRDYANSLNLNSVYTPQMIVNGRKEFVGSDKIKLKQAISESLNYEAKVNFKKLEGFFKEDGSFKINYELEGDYTDCKVNFALVSLNETTVVNRGENTGKTLYNKNIVNEFITKKASIEGEVTFLTFTSPKKSDMAIIAYIQKNQSSEIIGAAKAHLN